VILTWICRDILNNGNLLIYNIITEFQLHLEDYCLFIQGPETKFQKVKFR
jgi:hypothetical protein